MEINVCDCDKVTLQTLIIACVYSIANDRNVTLSYPITIKVIRILIMNCGISSNVLTVNNHTLSS